MSSKTFYYYFKPIAVLCKLLGIFPLRNLRSNDPNDLGVGFFTWAQLYSIVFFLLPISMMAYFGGLILTIDTDKMFISTVAYVMIIRSVICYIFCVLQSKKLPKLIRLLDTFDKKKNGLLIEHECSISGWCKKCLAFWTIGPIIKGFIAFAIAFYESSVVIRKIFPPNVRSEDSETASYFFGALSIWQIEPLLLYMYFALRIRFNFDAINRTMVTNGYCGNFFEDEKRGALESSSLEYFRLMHNMMSEAVHELGKCYGSFMAIDQLSVIIMIVVNICAFIYDRQHNLDLLVLTIFNLLIVIVVVEVSDQIAESGRKAVDLLHGLRFAGLSENCKSEIQAFMMQISVRPVEVSASGYFIIDKKQIPSMLASIATYLIVLLQFLNDGKIEIL